MDREKLIDILKHQRGCKTWEDLAEHILALEAQDKQECLGEEEIYKFLTDHYWDSLEKDRGLIEVHCKFLSQALAGKVAKVSHKSDSSSDKVKSEPEKPRKIEKIYHIDRREVFVEDVIIDKINELVEAYNELCR